MQFSQPDYQSNFLIYLTKSELDPRYLDQGKHFYLTLVSTFRKISNGAGVWMAGSHFRWETSG
jgi:hypothetical protein